MEEKTYDPPIDSKENGRNHFKKNVAIISKNGEIQVYESYTKQKLWKNKIF